MKKSLLTLAFGLAATAAFAAETALTDLNAEVARLLAPFQGEQTLATVVFSHLEVNDERALGLEVSGRYRKVGTQNQFDFNVENLSYQYGDGTAPTTKLRGYVAVDLTKIIPQEQLNRLVPAAETLVQNLAQSFTSKYGDAVTIEARVTEKNQDAQGNYTSLQAEISGRIDLTKLPETMKSEDVLVKEGRLVVRVDVKEGLRLDVSAVSNPEYKGFRKDSDGLKEMIEKLLSRDERTLQEIVQLARSLDGFANEFVNGKKD